MATINVKRKFSHGAKVAKPHLNYMGGTSFDINNPITKLKVITSSCFFGEPQFYNREAVEAPVKVEFKNKLTKEKINYLREFLCAIDSYEWRRMSPAKAIEVSIDEALKYNIEETLNYAVYLRNTLNIRVTSQVILVRAANSEYSKGTGLIRKYGSDIVKRMDEPSTGLAYQLSAYGRSVPSSLKRLWKDKLENASEYELAKYRMEEREVKTIDVVRFVHAKGPFIDKLCRNSLKLGDDIKTWESIRSSGGKWEDAINVMGHMALLRNLRNFIENKISSSLYLEKLIKTASTGKQLPFRYVSAYNSVKDLASGNILDSIEECLKQSIGALPYFDGKSLILVDNSGSARSATTSSMGTVKICDIGNLMGVLTGMRSEEGVVGVFGDNLKYVNIRKTSSVFDQLKTIDQIGCTIGHSTENGIWLALDEAIKNNIHYDYIWVYSDMQAGHGGLYGKNSSNYKNYNWFNTNHIDVAKMIMDYRNKVNKNVKVFLVQIAGYADTLIPEFYKNTYILGGWSEEILKFAKLMETL